MSVLVKNQTQRFLQPLWVRTLKTYHLNLQSILYLVTIENFNIYLEKSVPLFLEGSVGIRHLVTNF